jgi:hypothetical protein
MFEFLPRVNQTVGYLLSPISHFLYRRLFLTPNKLSILAFLLGTSAVVFILMHQIGLAMILVGISLIIDMFDGLVARQFHLETKIGKQLDLAFDRTNEAMLFIALAYIDKVSLKIALLAILAILLMSVLKKKSKFDPGFKRIILFVGYGLNNFELALQIIFFVNLAGFAISTIILDYNRQVHHDASVLD